MPNQMSVVYLYPRKAPVEDFISGKAAVGSGPYKFVEWIKGDRLVMARNDDFWGQKPEFDRVVFKPIKSDPSRVAALLSGEVDIIDQVPTTDVGLLKNKKDLRVVSTAGERIIMLQMDANRDGVVDREELRFTKRVANDQDEEGWAVDTKILHDDDFSYALGAKGSTRRKLAKAAGPPQAAFLWLLLHHQVLGLVKTSC